MSKRVPKKPKSKPKVKPEVAAHTEKESSPATEIPLASEQGASVISDQLVTQSTTQPAEPAGAQQMDLTLSLKPGVRKSDRLVIYDLPDRKGSVQFLRTLFGDEVPQTIVVSGDFAPPATRKVTETKEERKVRLAAETPADKIARAEARIARLKEKMLRDEARRAEQPAA